MTGRAQKRQHGLDIPLLMKRATKITLNAQGQGNVTESLELAPVRHGQQGLLATPWHAEAPRVRILAAGMGSA